MLCCYLLYAWHVELSENVALTYSVVGLAGLSLLAWPLFLVQLLGALARRALKRGL